MAITSPSSIKSCYVAQALEELGMPVKRAHNRLSKGRKVETPGRLKPFIHEAIQNLIQEQGEYTYREIQERTLHLLQAAQQQSIVQRSRGLFSEVQELAREITHDRSLFYTE